ncbi:alpha-amylase family glycosyl hydrolase [Rhizobium sp. RHZ02]|uniref:alpha-amylase family glycosyl hydrolase n=1 Tax=Rhizobium sp. RHZ02 TaxID=2769306 RepID=UPI001FEE8E25|nr:alpha-amylase family glycosyl hydrolase [Rhizobium sp. RHZ02]
MADDADYWFVLADGTRVPDPASRRQSAGVLGPSCLWGSDFNWKVPWKGRPWEEAIIYEIHIGTFTAEGTFAAAEKHLHRLAELGVSAVQIMPLAQFPGTRGWGYDGVYPYAPHNSYGSPDDVKSFVDEAHRYGLMVFLDVVYNHFGPEGNFLPLYAAEFFRKDDPTPWGPKIAFEREPVRRFFIDNVIYWLDQFRFDGLRFDAVDQIEGAPGDRQGVDGESPLR